MVFDSDDETAQASPQAASTFVVLAFELPSLLLLLLLGSMPDASSGAAALDAQPGLELACRIALVTVAAAVLFVAARRRYWPAACIQACALVVAAILAPAWH
jgi:hypothetical protein